MYAYTSFLSVIVPDTAHISKFPREGFVISVIYVLVSNMFDNTIKDADDIESNSELITLVSIPFVNEDSKRGGIY